jgi:hypothetical protein
MDYHAVSSLDSLPRPLQNCNVTHWGLHALPKANELFPTIEALISRKPMIQLSQSIPQKFAGFAGTRGRECRV